MSSKVQSSISEEEMLRMTTEVVSAYIGNNSIPASQIPEIIKTVHTSLASVGGQTPAQAMPKPAVPVRRSITPDYLVCLEDGKRLKMLKRHLRTNYNMTPEEYRAKWGLPADYPMVAPKYAQQRSDFAKRIGLGRRTSGGTSGRRATAH